MTTSLIMAMLISIVIFNIGCSISSREVDQYSQDIPEDINISPISEFDIHVEAPEPYIADSPEAKYDVVHAPHYSQKQLKFLEDCAQKSTTKCGVEVFENMVDETTHVTNECCRELLKLGKDCHLGLVQIIFATYEYKNIASKAIPESKHTWNTCVRQVGSQIGVPVSLEQ
ncbi:Protein DOWN-REGULATED IN DIF1 11 [Cardamine amara subsp. amara]|uniref:Protein DOWN-REGULATED IN DIF1 11 n=1 Tax=Cardamine amara subsp. amara TaxID=228776 RepID=A0ABD0ZYF7_CARAN